MYSLLVPNNETRLTTFDNNGLLAEIVQILESPAPPDIASLRNLHSKLSSSRNSVSLNILSQFFLNISFTLATF